MEIIDKRFVDNISTDVVVVGGGAAGVAAANTIANQNLKVVLIEKYGFCGGGAALLFSFAFVEAYLSSLPAYFGAILFEPIPLLP